MLSVGHKPVRQLAPQDEALFRAFQANLLSLISHELRTPLTGIINALALMEEVGNEQEAGMSRADLLVIARQNTHRLHRTLSTLLDLAEMESGSYHVKLKEVDIAAVVAGRITGNKPLLAEKNAGLELCRTDGIPCTVLADPRRLARALDLCIQSAVKRIAKNTRISLSTNGNEIIICYELETGTEKFWEDAWNHALVGFKSGVMSPASAFGGVMQSEEAFLARLEEGLGGEFALVHEIMKLHHGVFEGLRRGRKIQLALRLPDLSHEDALKAVLSSRTARVAPESGETGCVVLAMLRVPDDCNPGGFVLEVRSHLFRASDAVYPLSAQGRVALVLDDCKAADAPGLLKRIEGKLGRKLKFGIAASPADGVDADTLIKLANSRVV